MIQQMKGKFHGWWMPVKLHRCSKKRKKTEKKECLQHIRIHILNASKTYLRRTQGSKHFFFKSEQPTWILHSECSWQSGFSEWLYTGLLEQKYAGMSVCENVQTNIGHATRHDTLHGKSRSYWLYEGFQSLAVELVPGCPQVHTRCPWAALPRFPHLGWPPLAACAGSARHNHTAKLRLCIKPAYSVSTSSVGVIQILMLQHVCLKRKKNTQNESF